MIVGVPPSQNRPPRALSMPAQMHEPLVSSVRGNSSSNERRVVLPCRNFYLGQAFSHTYPPGLCQHDCLHGFGITANQKRRLCARTRHIQGALVRRGCDHGCANDFSICECAWLQFVGFWASLSRRFPPGLCSLKKVKIPPLSQFPPGETESDLAKATKIPPHPLVKHRLEVDLHYLLGSFPCMNHC